MINPDSFDITNPLTLLRILAGIYFLPHVYNMIVNRAAVADFFGKVGFSPSSFFVSVAVLVEGLCGFALIADIYTPYAALLAAALLVVAAFAIFKLSGFKWLWISGGFEFPIFWALVCVILAIGHFR